MLRVGTDCSGMEAPIQALKKLKTLFSHEFSSDIDRYCIKSIKANYKPRIIFGDSEGDFPNGDITKRDITTVPDIDLYVAGFPCQPFSNAGLRKGFKDKRGNVFWSCLEVITVKQPKYFVLENVKGMLNNDNGKTWGIMWEAIKGLEQYGYTVKWRVLNTKDYGIPQNRERVFIVGTKTKFEWPKTIRMKKISTYVDNSVTEGRHVPKHILDSKLLDIVPDNSVFIDFGFRHFKHPRAGEYCPCITAYHACSLWCVKYNRFATVKELLRLQGFPTNFKYKGIVSNTQIKKQIGNSMSVCVLQAILKNLLK